MTSSDFAVIEHQERFKGPIFSVVTDQVAMPGGRTAGRDYVVHLGAVGVVALDDEDRIVLVQQYRHPLRRRVWELPAGLVDVAGEPLVDAAARELAEEAELRAKEWALLVDAHTSPGYSTELIRLFLARDLSPVPEEHRYERTDEEATMITKLVPLDEAVAMALRGEITNAASLVGIFAAADLRARDWPPLRPADTPPWAAPPGD